jgi:predicted ABC-type ATPase
MLRGERSPSLRENIAEGNYGTAALQGLGSLGDAAYLIPGAGAILGPTIGSVLKAPRAVQKLLRASDAAEEGIGSIPQSAAVMPDDDALMAMDFATEMQDLQRLIDDDINIQNPDFLMVLEEHPAVIKGTAALEDIPVTSNDPLYGSMEWDGGRSFNFEDDGRIVVGYEEGVEKLYDRSRKLGFIDDKMEYPGPQPRAEGQKPRAVIVVGPPASGKSSISNPIARKLDATIIDSDEAKKLLPEYQGGVGANAVHKESKRITGMVQDIAVANGDNLVIPTVGDEVESIRKKAMELKDAGYEVDLVDVVVPAKEAKKRMIARFAKTGRIIPFEYLRTVGDNPTKNYDLLREEGVFDGYARIDNSVGFRDAKPLIEDTRELFKGTEVRLQDRRAGGGGRSQESPIPSDSAADLREAEKQRGIGSL